MKKTLFSGLLIFLASFLYCQISINRSDVFDYGDKFPRIYYAFEVEGDGYHVDSLLTTPLVFDDLDFPYVEIDTLIYTNPSETDVGGIYADATCSFIDRGGFTMYMFINEAQMRLIGLQGRMPMNNDIMSLVFSDTLIMNKFPCNFGDLHQDSGSAFENRHISVFENLIPDYYAMVSMIYDTVKFKMDLEIYVEYDEFGSMKCVGDSSINGTFMYLRENRQMINIFDVQLRLKTTGVYTSLGDIPFIASQLLNDIPIIDTIASYLYWTKDNKNPMVEIEMNTKRDLVYNVTYRYAYLSNLPSFDVLKHSVFPNPADNYFIVNIPDFNNQKLEIYSIEGAKIKKIILSSQSSKIDISEMSKGTYIYRIMDKTNKAVAGGKFVKQ